MVSGYAWVLGMGNYDRRMAAAPVNPAIKALGALKPQLEKNLERVKRVFKELGLEAKQKKAIDAVAALEKALKNPKLTLAMVDKLRDLESDFDSALHQAIGDLEGAGIRVMKLTSLAESMIDTVEKPSGSGSSMPRLPGMPGPRW